MLRIFVVEEELHKTSNLLDELRAQLVQSKLAPRGASSVELVVME